MQTLHQIFGTQWQAGEADHLMLIPASILDFLCFILFGMVTAAWHACRANCRHLGRLYYRLCPHADSEGTSPQLSESKHAKANTTKERLHKNRTKLRRVGERLVENPMLIRAGWFESDTAPKKESFSP